MLEPKGVLPVSVQKVLQISTFRGSKRAPSAPSWSPEGKSPANPPLLVDARAPRCAIMVPLAADAGSEQQAEHGGPAGPLGSPKSSVRKGRRADVGAQRSFACLRGQLLQIGTYRGLQGGSKMRHHGSPEGKSPANPPLLADARAPRWRQHGAPQRRRSRPRRTRLTSAAPLAPL